MSGTRSFVLVFLLLSAFVGCDVKRVKEIVSPPPQPPGVDAGKDEGAGTGRVASRESYVEPARPVRKQAELEDVDIGEPPSSGYEFTLWEAKASSHALTIKYRHEGARVGTRKYQMVIDANTQMYFAEFTQWGRGNGRGVFNFRLPIGTPAEALDSAVLYVETADLIGRSTGDRASNAVTIKAESRFRQRVAQSDKSSTPAEPSDIPDGLSSAAIRALKAMRASHSKEKVVTIKVVGIAELDVVSTLLERTEALAAKRPGLETAVKVAKEEGMGAKPSAVVIMAPIDDIREAARTLDVGDVVDIDTNLRVISVEANPALFPNNAAGIAKDPQHPDFFKSNLAILSEKSNPMSMMFMTEKQASAMERLALADPNDCEDRKLRASIARKFRDILFDGKLAMRVNSHSNYDSALNGLLKWGGTHSVPQLLKLLSSSYEFGSDEFLVRNRLIAALGRTRDARAAAGLTELLVKSTKFGSHIDRSNVNEAIKAIVALGAVAEEAVLEIAPSSHAEVSLTAINMLAQVGTEKSRPLLRKARTSKNAAIRQAAKLALQGIDQRTAADQ